MYILVQCVAWWNCAGRTIPCPRPTCLSDRDDCDREITLGNFVIVGAELNSGNQLQVVRLVGDRAIAVGAHDGPLLQIENAGHLIRIFLNHANALRLHCA